MQTKISGKFVIGYDGNDHVIYKDGEVVYKDDTIVFVGHNYPGNVQKTINAGDAIISPGFIDLDALGDIDHAILDNWVPPDINLGLQWSENYFTEGRHDVFSPQEQSFNRRYALTQLIMNGITTAMLIAAETYKEWAETYQEFADVVDIAADLGIRAYLGPSYRSGVNVIRSDGSWDVMWEEDKGLEGLEGAIRFVNDFDDAYKGLIKACLVPARIETCTLDLLRRTKRYADELGCLVRLHCLQGFQEIRLLQKWYQKEALEILSDLNFLGPRTLIPHAIHIVGYRNVDRPYTGELEVLRETGTSIIHCPLTSARHGNALESFDRYSQAGVNIALGTDTFPPDMLRVMDYGSNIGKIIDKNMSSHRAADFYRAATLGGAKALGRDDLGRLSPGTKADIIVVDLNSLRTGPIDDPIRTMLMNATGANIRTVVINGRIVMQDWTIPGVDMESMRIEGQKFFAKYKQAYSERDYLQRPTEILFPPSFRLIER